MSEISLSELVGRAIDAGEDAGMVTRAMTDEQALGYVGMYYRTEGYPQPVVNQFWASFRDARKRWRSDLV